MFSSTLTDKAIIYYFKELQYCAKVMQAIIVEYRENRDISAIFNANNVICYMFICFVALINKNCIGVYKTV